MILYIDATDMHAVRFALAGKGIKMEKTYVLDAHQGHAVLKKLESFLGKFKGARHAEIKKIVVNKGPGSYTGVRVSLAQALALGFAWNIPVAALPKSKFNI